jgi:predicted NUDIX family phosphoesterase
MADLTEAPVNDLQDFDRLAAQVLEKIPLGQELVRLGPRPLFIEFCGTPKSGKTSCADKLLYYLRKKTYNAVKMVEKASVCPLPKNRATFNVWTACATVNQILESADQNLDIVILDRGIFDALCWMNFMEKAGRLEPGQRNTIESFLLMEDWRDLIDVVFVMTTTPEKALEREWNGQLIHQEGSTMNVRTLKLFNQAIDETLLHAREQFRSVNVIDTTNLERIDSLKKVTTESLMALDHLLDEKIFVFSRELLSRLSFTDGATVDLEQVRSFLEIIDARHYFVERRKAEADAELVQVIPSAIVEYDGKLLLLRRKERDVRDRLHNKYAIWAGGHAREQDRRAGGNTIENALRREISEELLIRRPLDFELIGLAYDRSNKHSALHLGIVYRVKVGTSEVSLAMDQQEFKEKKGLSVSGKFFSPEEIVEQYSKELEPWSRSLLASLYRVHAHSQPDESGQSNLL